MNEYEVIVCENAVQLATSVERMLEDGWMPQGGVAVTVETQGYEQSALIGGGLISMRRYVFAQALVRSMKEGV